MAMSGAALLRCRDGAMSAPMYRNSFALRNGGAKKSCFQRFSRVGVCVSSRRTLSKLKVMGTPWDRKALPWRDRVGGTSHQSPVGETLTEGTRGQQMDSDASSCHSGVSEMEVLDDPGSEESPCLSDQQKEASCPSSDGSDLKCSLDATLFTTAYQIFCETIIRGRIIVDRQVLKIPELKMIFSNLVKEHEGLDASDYSQERLRRRLERDFPQLVFHTPPKRSIGQIVFVEEPTTFPPQNAPQPRAKKARLQKKSGIKLGKDGKIPKIHLGRRVLCPECGIFYSSQTHRCDANKTFVCPDCDRGFTSEAGLDAHRRLICRGKTNYPCKFCLHPCETWQEKRRHEKSHEQSQEDQLYLCSKCPQTFEMEVERNEHIQEQHPTMHECLECHKVFAKHNQLEQHIFTHSRPFKCQVCSRPFALNSQLKSHMRVHTGERPYSCQHCPKCFITIQNLKKHVTLHHQRELQHNPGSDTGSDEQRLSCHSPDPETVDGEVHSRVEKERSEKI